MKISRLSLFLLCSVLFLSNCTSDDDNQTTLKETAIIDPDTGKPTFTIVSDNLVETNNGYDFEGTLQTQTEDGEDYDIVVGDISVEVDTEGNIIEISGEGYPNFPDLGNFKTIVRDFEWKKKIKSLVMTGDRLVLCKFHRFIFHCVYSYILFQYLIVEIGKNILIFWSCECDGT